MPRSPTTRSSGQLDPPCTGSTMRLMHEVARGLVSEEEFLALPESVNKIELIDGEVIVSPSPSFWHQEVLRRIVLALGKWAEGYPGPVTVAQAPLDVRI